MTRLPAGGERRASKLPAIVLGVEHPRGVAVVRSLARAGIPVIAIDHVARPLGFHSRHVSRSGQVSADPAAALRFLERLGQEGGGVLIATNDHYLVLVAQNHDRLARAFVLTTPRWEVLEALMARARAYEIARAARIAVPVSFEPGSVAEMRKVVAGLDLAHRHYLLKTRVDRGHPADLETKRFTKVAGPDTAAIERSCLEIFARAGEWPSLEEVVPAEADRCIGVAMVVDRNHEPVLSYCVRRLKLFTYSRGGDFVHPYELGANVYCESVHDSEASDAAARFVKQARYSGPITVEFRRSSVDDRLTFIKADPRVVRATALSTALGLDVPLAIYRAALGRAADAAASYPDHRAWIWLNPYVRTLWRHRGNQVVRQELVNLARNFRNIKAEAYLDWRDPKPFLMELARSNPTGLRRRARDLIGRRRVPATGAS
jgi:predicted ATP-grasp superfamily ATP-dependent carboligase